MLKVLNQMMIPMMILKKMIFKLSQLKKRKLKFLKFHKNKIYNNSKAIKFRKLMISLLFKFKNHKFLSKKLKINKKMKMGKERKRETEKETRTRIKKKHEIFDECKYTLAIICI